MAFPSAGTVSNAPIVAMAAAAAVEHALSLQADSLVDPVEAQRVDVVQWLEFAGRIPPAVGEVAEFFKFGGVCVEHVSAWLVSWEG